MTSERHCLEQIAVSLVEIQQTLVEIHKMLILFNNPPIVVKDTEPLIDHDHKWRVDWQERCERCIIPGCNTTRGLLDE